MSIIKRIRYLEHIKTYIDKDLIKVFVGQRRVGKSYLMKMTANYILEINPQANIIFIDKDPLYQTICLLTKFRKFQSLKRL